MKAVYYKVQFPNIPTAKGFMNQLAKFVRQSGGCPKRVGEGNGQGYTCVIRPKKGERPSSVIAKRKSGTPTVRLAQAGLDSANQAYLFTTFVPESSFSRSLERYAPKT